MLAYKGYKGQFDVDMDSEIIFGKVLGIRDVITFKGKNLAEVKQAFYDSVDDYLEFCQELGEKPNKPFSGKLPYRTTPENHRLVYMAAKKSGKSINSWMDETLINAASDQISSSINSQESKTLLAI